MFVAGALRATGGDGQGRLGGAAMAGPCRVVLTAPERRGARHRLRSVRPRRSRGGCRRLLASLPARPKQPSGRVSLLDERTEPVASGSFLAEEGAGVARRGGTGTAHPAGHAPVAGEAGPGVHPGVPSLIT